MKLNVSGAMKRFSGAIIQPILFLCVIGILIAFNVILAINGMPAPVVAIGTFVQDVMVNAGVCNLSVILCIGLTAALAKKKRTDAAVVAIISFLVFLYANNSWLTLMGTLVNVDTAAGATFEGTGQNLVLGVQVVDMGVFLGILLGCLDGWIFNKTCDAQFPEAIRVYGGSRFSALLCIFVAMGLGIVMSYVWPVVNGWIIAASNFIQDSGDIGLFVYGFLNRFLIPTGLHHLVYMPFVYSSIGGTATIAGQTYEGAGPIWYAELANAASVVNIDPSIKYTLFGFSKVFGTIGSVLAFIHTAKPERKADTRAVLIPVALVAILAGITEPLEFLYLFASPLLWLVHSVLDGVFQVLIYDFGFQSYFAGGVVEGLPGIIAFPTLSHWWILLIFGAIGVVVWYFAFVFLIKRFNLKTPGREDEEGAALAAADAAGAAKAAAKAKEMGEGEPVPAKKLGAVESLGDIQDVIDGLGGPENILSLENCFTRLRIELKDVDKLDKAQINKFKNSGIMVNGNAVQIIIGTKVDDVGEAMRSKLGRAEE